MSWAKRALLEKLAVLFPFALTLHYHFVKSLRTLYKVNFRFNNNTGLHVVAFYLFGDNIKGVDKVLVPSV